MWLSTIGQLSFLALGQKTLGTPALKGLFNSMNDGTQDRSTTLSGFIEELNNVSFPGSEEMMEKFVQRKSQMLELSLASMKSERAFFIPHCEMTLCVRIEIAGNDD